MTDNELIAEFMGFFAFDEMPISGTKIYKLLDSKGNPVHPFYGPMRPEQMQFKTNWNWLMPVVAKIIGLYRSTFPTDFTRRVIAHEPTGIDAYMDVIALPVSTSIEEVYQAVVVFIKNYNNNTNERTE